MILDVFFHEERYSILDEVIYNHGRIFLSRASKLKEKLLQRAYEEFNFSHTNSITLNNIILRSYYSEGFERELYQHCQRCMDIVEMEQQHDSKEELNQPSHSSLEEESRSMHHSIDGRRIVGEEHALSTSVLYSNFMHYYTIFLQAMTPRRSNIFCKPHGQYSVSKISELGHSLGRTRDIFHHDGCFPKAPNISHTFSYGEMELGKPWLFHVIYCFLIG